MDSNMNLMKHNAWNSTQNNGLPSRIDVTSWVSFQRSRNPVSSEEIDNYPSHPLSSPLSQSSQISMDSGFLEQASTSPTQMGITSYQQTPNMPNAVLNNQSMQSYNNYNEFDTMQNSFQDFYQGSHAPVTISLPPQFSPTAVVPNTFSPSIVNPEKPFLEIIEEPTDKPFRFRYKSEMHGTHGSLMGSRTERSKRTYPTVSLRNFNFAKAIIRCSLYQVPKKTGERSPHSHKLVIRRGDAEQNDPHDIEVSSQNDFTAVFQGMGIIHTKKPKIKEELIRKLSEEKVFENGSISPVEMMKIEEKAENQSKEMNLNQVCLCFQAYIRNEIEGTCIKICEPVYSNVVNNMKSALVGELRICRMSSYTSPAAGKQEIFMFVEKVCKTNIKVKFYKLREDNTVEWEDFADFNDSDVHHQYGIVLKTPPYDSTKKLDEPVTVKVQLYRPSDGCVSESLDFRYKPDNHAQRKRPRSKSPDYTIPTVVNQRPDCHNNSNQFIGGMNNNNDPSGSFGDKFYQSPTGHYHENEESLFDQAQLPNYTATFLDLNFTENDFSSLPCSAEEFYRMFDLEVGGESKLQTDSAVVGRRIEIKHAPPAGIDCSMLDKLKTLIKLFKNNFDEEKLQEMMMSLIEAQVETGENILLDCIQLGTLEEIRDLVLILVKYKLMDVLKSKNDLDQNCFHLLIQAGCANLLRVFSYLGVDVNQADAFGQTPLHLAVANNYQDCVKELIESSATIKLNELNDDGFTPLHLAVKSNNFDIVDDLVDAGADFLKISPPTGDNVLHMAVEAEEFDMDMIKFFVEFDESLLHQENNAGLNVLQVASEKNQPENLIQYLSAFYEEIYTKTQTIDTESDEEIEEIFLDEQGLKDLGKIFDKNGKWRNLAKLMGFDEKIGGWEKTESPTKHLFIHFKETKKPLEDICRILVLLDESRATDVINEMVVRKYEN